MNSDGKAEMVDESTKVVTGVLRPANWSPPNVTPGVTYYEIPRNGKLPPVTIRLSWVSKGDAYEVSKLQWSPTEEPKTEEPKTTETVLGGPRGGRIFPESIAKIIPTDGSNG